MAHRTALTGAAGAPLQDRWAAASGFDDTPVDPDVAREVVMLCCAIKPLCSWNGQARPYICPLGYRVVKPAVARGGHAVLRHQPLCA